MLNKVFRTAKRMISVFLSAVILCSMLPAIPVAAAPTGPYAPGGEQQGVSLSALALTQGSLLTPFDPETTDYTAELSDDFAAVSVTATAEESGASIRISINGSAPVNVESGETSDLLPLEIGDNVVSVKLTSADGARSRTYRLTVPKATVVLQEDIDGYHGTTDAHVSEGKHKAKNTGLNNQIEVGYFDPEITDRKFGLFRFDLSSLPDGINLTEVQLELFMTGKRVRDGATFLDKTLYAHEIQGPWEEGNGNGFDGTDGASGVIWDTQPPFNSEAEDSTLVGTQDNVWYSWTITDMVRHWIGSPADNYGVLLKEQDVTEDDVAEGKEVPKSTKDFASAQHATPWYRPKLKLAYTQPLQGIVIDEEPLELLAGQPSYTISHYFVRPLNAVHTGVTWSSGDESIARVDAAGNVNAVGAGDTYITATVSDGVNTYNDQIEVHVTQLGAEALLSGLEVIGIDELTPAFTPVQFDYAIQVPLNTRQVTLMPTAYAAGAGVTVQAEGSEAQTVQSGTKSLPVKLDTSAESTLITVTVTAPGGEANEYTIRVNYRFTGGPADQIIREFLDPFGRVLVVAHRGNWLNGKPENGLNSIRESIDEGVDMVELDIRTTKDGVPVLMHDGNVDRTTNGTGNVRDMTLAQIKQLRLLDQKGEVTDEQVPTLEEVMELAHGKIMVNLDIKDADWDSMWGILVSTDTTDHALYKTRDSKANIAAKMARFTTPDSAMQPLFMLLTESTVTALDFLNPATTPFTTHAFEVTFSNDDDPIMNPDFIRQVHENGGRIWVNTIFSVPGMVGRHGDYAILNDPDAGFPWLIERGVNMIQTDTTALLLKYLRGELGGGDGPLVTQTEVLQEGVNGYSGTSDTYVIEWGSYNVRNMGGHTEFIAGYNSNGPGSNDRKHALLRFDLSSLPEGAVVTKAEMGLFLTGEGMWGSADKLFYVHEITEPWVEGEGKTHEGELVPEGGKDVTWATKPRIASEPVTSGIVGTEKLKWYNFDISPLAKKWVNEGQANYGIVLRDDDIDPRQPMKYFASSENKWVSWRPKLTVTYTVPAAGLEITPDRLELEIGQESRLTAVIMPEDAVNRGVSWSSDNENVARVDADGLVTAVNTGTARITAVAYDGGYSATAAVKVTGAANSSALSGLTLGAGNLTEDFNRGKTEYTAQVPEVYNSLTVTPYAEDADAAITVSINGDLAQPAVTGQSTTPMPLEIGENLIAIHVTSSDGGAGQTYTVRVPKAAVMLQEGMGGYTGAADTQLSKGTGSTGNQYYNWNLGGQHKIEAGYYNQTTNDEKYVMFRFDNLPLPQGATVTEATLGLYHIDARSYDRPRDLFAYQLNAPWVEGTGGDANSSDGSPANEGEVTWNNYINQTPLPYDNTKLLDSKNISQRPAWYAFNILEAAQAWADDPESNYGVLLKPEVYPDSSDATMTGTKRFITRENPEADKRPYLRLVYQTEAERLIVDKNSLQLAPGGDAVQLKATVRPLNAVDSAVAWSSGDEEVASVSQSGLVTPVGEGETVITAQGPNGLTQQVRVTVREAGTDGSIALVELTGGKLQPEFHSDLHQYEAIVPLGTSSVTVTPFAADERARVTISVDGGEEMTVSTGEAISVPVTQDSLILVRGRSENGQNVSEYEIRITLRDLNPLTGIEAEPASVTLTAGTTRPIKIYGEYTDGSRKELAGATFVPADPNIAEVSPGGTVFAKTPGRTVAEASYGGFTALVEITVTKASKPSGSDNSDRPNHQEKPDSPTTPEPEEPTTPATPEPEPNEPAPEFSDTADHWAKKEVAAAVEAGFVQGYPDGSFKPDERTTRAQFAAMLVRALKLQGTGELDFADRDSIPDWAIPELTAAVEAGILQGYDDATLRPNEIIGRAEMVTMLMRAFGRQGDASQPGTFADDQDIPQWALPFVYEAGRLDLITGYPDGSFRPDERATRAQAVSVIIRMLNIAK